jgi:hypothetical protein
MRGDEWVGEIGKGLTAVTVRVREPEVTHTVRMNDFRKLAKTAGQDAGRNRSQVAPAAASRHAAVGPTNTLPLRLAVLLSIIMIVR